MGVLGVLVDLVDLVDLAEDLFRLFDDLGLLVVAVGIFLPLWGKN